MTQQKSSKKGDSIKNIKPKAVESSISSVQVAQESNRKSQKSKKSKKLDASKKHVNHPLPRQMLRVQRSESVGGVVRMEMRYVSYERKEDCDVGEDGSVAMESKAVVAILKKLLTELGALSVDEESSDDKSDSTPNSSSNRPVKHHQKNKREKGAAPKFVANWTVFTTSCTRDQAILMVVRAISVDFIKIKISGSENRLEVE